MNRTETYWRAWLHRLTYELHTATTHDRERELDDAISIAQYIHWKAANT